MTVQFQLVDGEFAHVRQRRIAAAEVIDGDPDPVFAQLPQDQLGPLHVVQEEVFGDLDGQLTRVQAAVGQRGGDRSRQPQVGHRRREDVDRHRRVERRGAPLQHVVEGLVDHEVVDATHQAVPAHQRQELVRCEHAALGMWPAHQGLDSRDRPGPQVELGLVDQGQFELVDGLAQFTQQADRFGSAGPRRRGGPVEQLAVACLGQHHLGVEGVHAAGAGPLRGVHRHVGPLEQVDDGDIGIVGLRHRQPHAGPHQ